MPDVDVIVVGGGIAGASAALALSADREVLLLEAEAPAAGASGAAAGLVNPLMGRKAKAVWCVEEALDAFDALLDEADARPLFNPSGVLRPVVEAKQIDAFQQAAARHPDLATWLSADAVRDRFPGVTTAGGALHIRRGGAVEVPALIAAMLAAATHRGATLRTGARVLGWHESDRTARVDIRQDGEPTMSISARHVLIAVGQGYTAFPALSALGLRGVKGQTLCVRRPDEFGVGLPLAGRGYIVPVTEQSTIDSGALVLGSSYEHDFDDLAPSDDATRYIRRKTAQMFPGVETAEILDTRVGVRVYAPGTNLPIVGPLPGHTRCWIFTGLGSKGLLTAPLLARALPDYLDEPASIPREVRISPSND